MTEEKRRAEITEDGGPGQIYMPFVVMDDLLDKLKLLNYDQDFSRELRIRPLSRHYFAIQTNPGEQFYMFTTLSAWLIRKCGKQFDTPQEYDDPNSTISNILDVLRQMGVTIDFPPNKLKQGFGEQVIFVLDRLADQALKVSNFSWKKPVLPKEETEEETLVDDNAEVTLEKVEEEMLADADDDEDDEVILDLEGLKNMSTSIDKDCSKPEEVLESTTDSSEWKLEVERVQPQLKITIKNDIKDWRSRVEQMYQHRKEIEESLSTTRTQLDKLYSEINRVLEKVGSREKYLNNQLEQQLLEYRSGHNRLSQSKEQYRSVSGGVTERSRILSQITEDLESVKQEMDERGSSMTDGTPLVNIRKALTRLKNEINQMNVRTGVAGHTLLQAKLKEKGNLQRATTVPIISGGFDSMF